MSNYLYIFNIICKKLLLRLKLYSPPKRSNHLAKRIFEQLSDSAEEMYIDCVYLYLLFHNKQHSADFDPELDRIWLLDLLKSDEVRFNLMFFHQYPTDTCVASNRRV